jgi:hypothetical protein
MPGCRMFIPKHNIKHNIGKEDCLDSPAKYRSFVLE